MESHNKISERDRLRSMSHVRNLIAIAITDGSFDNKEKELVFELGIRSGLSKDELKQINDNPASVSYIQPDKKHEKIEQLYDLILLILVNNKVTANEQALCKTFALKLGIELNVVNKLIPALTNSISKGIAPAIAIKEATEFFE